MLAGKLTLKNKQIRVNQSTHTHSPFLVMKTQFHLAKTRRLYGAKYSRMDQVKFAFWLSGPYPFKFFKGCPPQIFIRPFLSTLSHVFCIIVTLFENDVKKWPKVPSVHTARFL